MTIETAKPKKKRKLLKSEQWAAEVTKGQNAVAVIHDFRNEELCCRYQIAPWW